VAPRETLPHPFGLPWRGRVPRAVWHTIGLIVAVLLAYVIWRGYQTPDFLLDLSSFRLC
jgi:hypothetical protein